MSTDSPGTDLVYAHASLGERKNYAQALATAGNLLPDGLMENGRPSAGKVFLVAETGNMLGIHPIAAITGVNIIKGKPTIAPTLMASLVRERGHKLRVKVAGSIPTGDIAVKVTLVRKDDPDEPFEVTWTMDEAIAAGLVDSYALNTTTKRWTVKAGGSWAKYPRQMLLHRATAEVCRQGASEVLMGVYTPEELGANVNSEGELLDVTSTAVDRTRYEQDHDGPAVVEAMRRGNPKTEPEPGNNGERGHASETEVVTRPDRDATPTADSRPRASRTVENSGTGRPDEPVDEQTDVQQWVDEITATASESDLRHLHEEAVGKGVLDTIVRHGRGVHETLEDTFRARLEKIREDATEVPLAAMSDYPEELPF